MLSAYIQSIGVLGPGLPDWPATAAILRGDSPYARVRTVLPTPTALPPAERRRAGRVIKLALAVGAQAVAAARADVRMLPSVFSSSGGDGDNCHEICVDLAAGERLISPTRFHNSVHNAASGYWTIAHGCTQPSIALCAYDGSFGAGLLEALSQLACAASSILLVSYDLDYPEPLRSHRPIGDAFAVALLLTANPAGPRLQLRFTDAAATGMADPGLEALRLEAPAARALPLLERLAGKHSGAVMLDYLEATRLLLEIET